VTAGLVLDMGGAQIAAERLLIEANAQRETLELTLPPSALTLELGDTIEADGERFEVAEIRDGLARKIAARAILPELDIAIVGERPKGNVDRPIAQSFPEVAAAHLPPAPDDIGYTRLALGAFAHPWPGRIQVTDGETGAELAVLPRAATLGTLTEVLEPASMFVWDDIRAIDVELLSGHLASRDENEVLAGANRVAVETDSGAWEIIAFAEAELIAPGMYRLSRLLRGQGGTDHAIGAASAGNRVLLLDTRTIAEDVDPAWLGAIAELRCFAGRADAEGTVAQASIDLATILPLRPVHLGAIGQTGGDIALSWVRRSRSDTDSWLLKTLRSITRRKRTASRSTTGSRSSARSMSRRQASPTRPRSRPPTSAALPASRSAWRR